MRDVEEVVKCPMNKNPGSRCPVNSCSGIVVLSDSALWSPFVPSPESILKSIPPEKTRLIMCNHVKKIPGDWSVMARLWQWEARAAAWDAELDAQLEAMLQKES